MRPLKALRHRTNPHGPQTDAYCSVDAAQKTFADFVAHKQQLALLQQQTLSSTLEQGRFHEAHALFPALQASIADLAPLEDALRVLASLSSTPVAREPVRTYHVNVLFMAALYPRLMTCEREFALSGAKLADNVYTLDTAVELEGEASAGHVSPTAESISGAQEAFWSTGQTIRALLHWHPGQGPSACSPSSIDLATQERIERAGFPAIGMIWTRDRLLRVFSALHPFAVQFVGKGMEIIDGDHHLYQLDEQVVANVSNTKLVIPA